MCGIAGIIDKSHTPRASLEAEGRAMTDALRHRGPDAGGTWQDPDAPVLLGHRRLSIIDISPLGAQPMLSATGRYAITYNGEIYNFPDLRAALETANITFRGRSDTEILLAAIEHWGLNTALQKIEGMFAFALWDRHEKMLHFARDRLGKKPLYIGMTPRALLFASELKALRTRRDFDAAIDDEAAAQYFRRGYIAAPRSIYKNAVALPPGRRLSLRLDALPKTAADLIPSMQPYWDAAQVLAESRALPHHGSESEIVQEFTALLTGKVRERMISDVPLGAFLSGGIDSSAIVALMQSLSGRPVKTFTIGFDEGGYDEAQHAETVAQHLGTDHHALRLQPEAALALIPRLAEIYDEPLADPSALPTLLVSEFARNHVTVALTGDGGDEMLGGYNRHIGGAKLWGAGRLLPRPLRSALAGLLQALPQQKYDRLVPKHPQFGLRVHKAAGLLQAASAEDAYDRLTRLAPLPAMQQNPAETLATPAGLSFAETLMFRDTVAYLPGDILPKVDRASMAVGLEARAPLLDRHIYEFVWRLPQHYRIRDGRGKWLLRQVLAQHIPPALTDRPKQGFTVPLAEWLRGPLKIWAQDRLHSQSFRDQHWINPALADTLWQEHLQGRGRHAEFLWALLVFESWRDRWV